MLYVCQKSNLMYKKYCKFNYVLESLYLNEVLLLCENNYDFWNKVYS